MKHLSFFRKRYLINPRFQISFIAYNIGTAFILSAVFYCAIRYFFSDLASLGEEAGLPPEHVFFTFLADQTSMMNRVFGITFLITFAVLTCLGIYLSHKVAGPLYRFREHLNKIAKGADVNAVQFREGDYFQDLAKAYNDHLRRLNHGTDAAPTTSSKKPAKAA